MSHLTAAQHRRLAGAFHEIDARLDQVSGILAGSGSTAIRKKAIAAQKAIHELKQVLRSDFVHRFPDLADIPFYRCDHVPAAAEPTTEVVQ